MLKEYKLGESAKLLYEFTWNDFCDWYVEFAKQRFNNKETKNRQISEKVLIKVLNDILVMIHPFMPHITEELWHVLQLNQIKNYYLFKNGQFKKINLLIISLIIPFSNSLKLLD